MIKLALVFFLALVPAGPQGTLSIENQFVQAWNAWAPLREASVPGTVDARELKAWKQVREHWKTLERYMEHEH